METRIKKLTQTHSQKTPPKIFGIHGGGNIGLGLMADIVAKSQCGYRILATSNNKLACYLINSIHKLWLQHGESQNEVTAIDHVTMISRERHDVIRLYKEASLAAICVTADVLPKIAEDIAHGLIQRYQVNSSDLEILILMNLPNAASFVQDIIANEIKKLSTDKAEKILAGIKFVPTVIDRIVIPIAENKIKEQLKSQLMAIKYFNAASIDAIIAQPEKLTKIIKKFQLQFNLFNAEKNYAMYVNECFSKAHQFPTLKITKDITMMEAVKNKYINGPHAILAWLGALFGYATIADAIHHPAIFSFIKEMMENEIAPILSAEYPELTIEDLQFLEHTFLERCKVSFQDPITRVGRNALTKLQKGERISGTLELVYKHHLDIDTSRLEEGMAAGFLYASRSELNNPRCKKIKEIYDKNQHSLFPVLNSYLKNHPSFWYNKKDNTNVINKTNHLSKRNNLSY